MLKFAIVALSLTAAAAAMSAPASAGDYHTGYGRYSHGRHAYDWHRDHRPSHLWDSYRFERWRAWREDREAWRYARWWRRDY